MIGRLLRRFAPPPPEPARVVRLESTGAVYAIGDPHGCLDLYLDLERQIVDDAASDEGEATLIVLGDMVDRGPDTAGLLDHLTTHPPASVRRLCIGGNHEEMMRRAIDDAADLEFWLRVGGAETLASYGIYTEGMRHSDITHAIRASVPEGHMEFLRDLPDAIFIADHLFCHAGFDPDRPLDAQDRHRMLWGDPAQVEHGQPTAPIAVHGHTRLDDVLISNKRVCVDTGAYGSGRLSAIKVSTRNASKIFSATYRV